MHIILSRQISYDGWSSSYNETVELSKIRLEENKSIDDSCQLKAGDKVEAFWGSSWYKATIEEIKICHTKVSYKNYDQNWNTWMTNDRIRRVENKSSDKSHLIGLQRRI